MQNRTHLPPYHNRYDPAGNNKAWLCRGAFPVEHNDLSRGTWTILFASSPFLTLRSISEEGCVTGALAMAIPVLERQGRSVGGASRIRKVTLLMKACQSLPCCLNYR
jgi:hypothetical protein